MRAPLVPLPAESERSLVMAFKRILSETDAAIKTGT
jgi:hypothetical protein